MHYQVDPTDWTPENGQTPHFWLLGSFKKAFLWFFNNPAWAIWQPNCQNHLVLSKYAMLSWSDAPNSRKWPKTSFLAIWISQNGIFVVFEWSSMGDRMANSCTPFSSIKICNTKSIWCTKLKKKAKNLIFGYLDHSKRHFCGFWMILHGWHDDRLMYTI